MSPFYQMLLIISGLCLPFFLLPWRYALRLAWAESIAGVLIWRLVPRVAASDMNVGTTILQATFAMVLVAVAMAFLTRLAIEAVRRARAGQPLYEAMPRIDRILALLTGATLAFIYFIALGWIFAGKGNVIALHAGLVVIAGALFWLAWRRGPGPARWSAAAMGATMLILVLGSLAYPWVMLRSATAVAGNAPYCIHLNQQGRFAQSPMDLTFLTADKQRLTPHMTLVIVGKPQLRMAGPHYGPHVWSYYRMQFQNETYALPGPTCPEGGETSGILWAARS
ncbi:hypothetical protein NOI20_06865 [Rhodobacteraceae bacterium 10Alg 79]|uniref:Uncharacterized protein n=1 Tax=Rhodalgimonas zhirmunskyi TaxID=2964767 RepID=A0AAJ1UCV1_9RHOB|nr:hypothetical protein [Rhodoalgimonas zhirmunskyi]